MESLKELYKIGTGPSSSHTMGPERAVKDFLQQYPAAARFSAVLYGSLALTGKGHLTDEIIIKTFAPKPCTVKFDSEKKELPHPNTLTLEAYSDDNALLGKQTYISVGGGTVRKEGEPETSVKHVYPFKNFNEILAYCREKNCKPEQVVFDFEGAEMYDFLVHIWETMQETIKRGLIAEGVLPGKLKVVRKAKTLFDAARNEQNPEPKENHLLCAYAFATAEENASGGTVVTAPTCGSCGILPAILYYMSEKHHLSERRIVAALATAGLVGVTVKQNASISGAEAGCQAEVGTATSMAAAAVARLFSRPLDEIEYAAEIALEHQLGLTCDPVCGYVQIPCIERNAVAALRALASAQLSSVLTGTRKISFDTVVQTMYETGKDMSARYRETAEGGLAANYQACD